MKNKTFHALSEPIKILRKLQAIGFTSAIIAGGAVRDDYADESINDFDIFMWDPNHSNEYPTKQIKEGQSNEDYFYGLFSKILDTDSLEQLLSSDPENGYAENQAGDGSIGAQLTSIWEGLTDFSLYQFIFTKINPVDHVNKYFDIGFCKAYCDGTKIRYTQDFLHDWKNKTFTIVGENMTQDQFNYVMEYHVDKLEWKYPHFQVEVAPHNQHLMKAYKGS